MKKIVFLLAGVYLLTACGKDPALADRSDHTYRSKFYTVGEARASYERACVTASRAEAEGVLTPGDYTLDWDQAQISIDSTLYSADVPIELAYEYYRYLEIEGEVYWIPLYPKLVTVTPPDKEHSSVYIRYYVPHEYYEWAHNPGVYDELLNSLPKQDFTGLSLYTNLNGDPVCVARYEEGRLETRGFLYDKWHTIEENAEVMTEILDGLRVGRATKSTSRGVNDINDIEPVIIEVGFPIDPFEDWLVLPVIDPNEGYSAGGGGGGSSGSGTGSGDGNGEGESSESSYEYNDKIKYEDEETVKPLLDSLYQDCMGRALINSLQNVRIFTGKESNASDGDTIYLEKHPQMGYRNYVFLEELFHCGQVQYRDPSKPFPSLNFEIEAKVAWLLYLERSNQTLSNQMAHEAFYSFIGYDAMRLLVRCYQTGEDLYSNTFEWAFTNVADELRMIYKNEKRYPFDSANRVFSILDKFMEECNQLKQ